MAKKFIPASEIQQGDTIKVTRVTVDGCRKTSVIYEGVAKHDGTFYEGRKVWRTEDDWNLYTHEDGVTIQLLDRPEPPKPVIVLPTRVGAIVRYTVDFDTAFPLRTAFRSKSGVWVCYNEEGDEQDKHFSDAIFADFLADSRFTPEVLFAGVSK